MRDGVFACLTSLASDLRGGGAEADTVEVIVVESSADGTAAALAAAFPFARVIAPPARLSAAAARNVGARAARGHVLAFIDADCTPAAGFARAVLAAHRAGARAVAGGVVPEAGAGATAFVLFCLEFSAQLPRAAAGGERVRFAPTCNLSLRRADLLAMGGFPEEHERAEDLAFCARWSGTIALAPEVRVAHAGPQRARTAARHLFRLGRASGRVRMDAELAPELAGAWLMERALRVPPLLPLVAAALVPYRYAAVAQRLVRADAGAGMAGRFVALTPLALAGLCAWAAGFAAGALSASGGRPRRGARAPR
jgi:hypothetical protein